jgi:peroxiredoxin
MNFIRPLIALGLFSMGCATGPIGKPAPNFNLPTLDGGRASLSDQKGKVLLLDFWATWCPNCPRSLAHAQQLNSDTNRTGRGLVVWTIDGADSPADIRAFLDKHHLNFPVAIDAQMQAISRYDASQLPISFIVGRDGIIKEAYLGFGEKTADKIDQAIDRALAEPAH